MSDQPELPPQPLKPENQGREEGSNIPSKGDNPPQRHSFKVGGSKATTSNDNTSQTDFNQRTYQDNSQLNPLLPTSEHQDDSYNGTTTNGNGKEADENGHHPLSENGLIFRRGSRT